MTAVIPPHPVPTPGPMSTRGIELIGHRGDPSRFPENTLPSLIGALEVGARSVEFDVRVAACGTPVLFHDSTVDRTTDGTGSLEERTHAELLELDAGGWFHPSFRDTRVPTLEEALRTTLHAPAPRRARRVYMELKSIRDAADLPRILEILHRLEAMENVIAISLDYALLRTLRTLSPDLRLGYVADDEISLEEGLHAVRTDRKALLDPDHRLLRGHPVRTSGWVEEGIRLVTWTVNEESHARELLALGVRRLATDDPGGLLAGITRGPVSVGGAPGSTPPPSAR
jgi:glycerophosphoryl diester phosphodiesterase